MVAQCSALLTYKSCCWALSWARHLLWAPLLYYLSIPFSVFSTVTFQEESSLKSLCTSCFLQSELHLTINVLREISTELHDTSFIYAYSSRIQTATGHHLLTPYVLLNSVFHRKRPEIVNEVLTAFVGSYWQMIIILNPLNACAHYSGRSY